MRFSAAVSLAVGLSSCSPSAEECRTEERGCYDVEGSCIKEVIDVNKDTIDLDSKESFLSTCSHGKQTCIDRLTDKKCALVGMSAHQKLMRDKWDELIRSQVELRASGAALEAAKLRMVKNCEEARRPLSKGMAEICKKYGFNK